VVLRALYGRNTPGMSTNSTTDVRPALDNSTQQTPIIVAWVVMTSLAAVTVALRCYTRCAIRQVFGAEDWLILVASV
jgi:hypothetical protein